MLNRRFVWFTSASLALYLLTLVFFFETPYGSTIFKDVTKDHWARYDIEYMYNQELMQGPDETIWNFYPNATLTRAELVGLMLKVDDVDITTLPQPTQAPYTDVATHWASGVLAEAGKRNLIPFTDVQSGGAFEPDKPVTRGEVAQALVQVLDLKTETAGTEKLTDVTGVPYEDAIRTVVANKFAKVGEFRPNDDAKRAEVASIFAQALKKLRPDTVDDKKGEKK